MILSCLSIFFEISKMGKFKISQFLLSLQWHEKSEVPYTRVTRSALSFPYVGIYDFLPPSVSLTFAPYFSYLAICRERWSGISEAKQAVISCDIRSFEKAEQELAQPKNISIRGFFESIFKRFPVKSYPSVNFLVRNFFPLPSHPSRRRAINAFFRYTIFSKLPHVSFIFTFLLPTVISDIFYHYLE